MTKKKYRRYSAEFKQQALRRASEDGVTDKEVCDELGVSERQLRRWFQSSTCNPMRIPKTTMAISSTTVNQFCSRMAQARRRSIMDRGPSQFFQIAYRKTVAEKIGKITAVRFWPFTD